MNPNTVSTPENSYEIDPSNVENSQHFSFPAEEERILDYWDSIDAFRRSLDLTADYPEYGFLDGPPFATGLPHHGHILAGTIKDCVLRFATTTGHSVERRFGWDCHGLPVEYEIDKKLGITSKADIERIGGIAVYNKECRDIVMRYSGEWEIMIRRMARWIDFRNDYKTMYPSFMESVWWVFGELYRRGQIYRGYRVMPYSTGCATPLSNFEVALNYKDVSEMAVTVKFPVLSFGPKFDATLLKTSEPVSLLVWTTTPWTLPSNLAICANPDLEYVLIESFQADGTSNGIFILAESLVASVIGRKDIKIEIKLKFNGSSLEGTRYAPVFDYYAHRKENGFPLTHTLILDSYVTSDAGTGLVHQSPAFGEEDFGVCLRYKIITESDVPCPIDDAGCFTAPVSDFVGTFWRDANNPIIRQLESSNRLFSKGNITHSCPHCWRSQTQLIYRIVPCWFVRVTNIIPQMIEAATKTHWVPSFVLEKRFHNWLEGSRDWAISRNRYWGNPIPVWTNKDYSEIIVVSSIAELERLSGSAPGSIKDLHRDTVDSIIIPSQRPPKSDGTFHEPLHRVEEVLDCWFESGSVPYAQHHYPYCEDKIRVESRIPADFIGEGLDQTRGWFYVLTVLGVHLFGKLPFKNLIVNGLVLAADGKKMSKSLKNYPEPRLIVDAHGADALRLYLIASPVVRAEPLRFKEEGVRGVVRDVLLPLYNALRFLEQAAQQASYSLGMSSDLTSTQSSSLSQESADLSIRKSMKIKRNTTDGWILAECEALVETVRTEMAAYRLFGVLPPIQRFVDSLTNWYVRLNRRRLRGDHSDASDDAANFTNLDQNENETPNVDEIAPGSPSQKNESDTPVIFSKENSPKIKNDQLNALKTLEHVLQITARVIAPFAPLFAETLYLRLNPHVLSATSQDQSSSATRGLGNDLRSVHFQPFPVLHENLRDPTIVSAFNSMRQVVDKARALREARTIPLKTPLTELVVLPLGDSNSAARFTKELETLSSYLCDELNVRCLRVLSPEEESDWGVRYKAAPNMRLLGRRLKKELPSIIKAAASLSQTELRNFAHQPSVDESSLVPKSINLCGETLTSEEFSVTRFVEQSLVSQDYAVGASYASTNSFAETVEDEFANLVEVGQSFVVYLHTVIDESLRAEGIARDLVSRVQRLRKRAGFFVSDSLHVTIRFPPAIEASTSLYQLLVSQKEYLDKMLKLYSLVMSQGLESLSLNSAHGSQDQGATAIASDSSITFDEKIEMPNSGFVTLSVSLSRA